MPIPEYWLIQSREDPLSIPEDWRNESRNITHLQSNCMTDQGSTQSQRAESNHIKSNNRTHFKSYTKPQGRQGYIGTYGSIQTSNDNHTITSQTIQAYKRISTFKCDFNNIIVLWSWICQAPQKFFTKSGSSIASFLSDLNLPIIFNETFMYSKSE